MQFAIVVAIAMSPNYCFVTGNQMSCRTNQLIRKPFHSQQNDCMVGNIILKLCWPIMNQADSFKVKIFSKFVGWNSESEETLAKVKEYCLFFGGKSNYKAWQYGEQTTSWLRALTLFLLFLFSFLWSVCSLFIQPCVALVQLGQGHLSSAIQRKSLQLQFPSQGPVLLLVFLLVLILVLILSSN